MIPSLLKDLLRTRAAKAPDRPLFPWSEQGGLARPLPPPGRLRARPHRIRRKGANSRQLQLPLH